MISWWGTLDRPVQVVLAAVLVLCAVPPATNVSPGMKGYALVLVVLAVVTLWLRERPVVAAPLTSVETLVVGGFIGWVAVGVLRAGDRLDVALVATLLAALVLACPWALARRVSADAAVTTVIAVCAAAVLGSVVAAWVVPLVTGHWVWLRPGLPLGGASNNSLGLTLALAGALVGARRWPALRWHWWGVAALAGLLLIQSVSRAGWVMGLVVLVAAAQLHRHWDSRHVVAAGGSVAVVAVAGLAWLRGPSFLIDAARWDNTARGLDAWWSSPGSVLFGHGSFRVWPWLATERDWATESVRGTMLQDGPWGRLLYHAHSTYADVLVEHGLVGLALLLAVLWLVCRRCIREIRQRGALALVAVAVLLALPAMAVELYLLRSFPSALLWWAAVLAVGRGTPGVHRETQGTHADQGSNGGQDRDRAGDQQPGREDLEGEAHQAHGRSRPDEVTHLAP